MRCDLSSKPPLVQPYARVSVLNCVAHTLWYHQLSTGQRSSSTTIRTHLTTELHSTILRAPHPSTEPRVKIRRCTYRNRSTSLRTSYA
eukprot:10885-Rhodomonas_salina.3